jgi:hypothetical protein
MNAEHVFQSCYHALMRTSTLLAASLCAAALLAGCSPTYNWRDHIAKDAPYRAMFPDKPATHTREVNLDGMAVKMTMTAAEVEGTIFAVGSGEAPSEALAEAALEAMKTALVRNIGATIASEQPGKLSAPANAAPARAKAIDLVANGAQGGRPLRLHAHLESRKTRFYQVIVIGQPRQGSATAADDNTEMFLSSFKLL